MKCRFQYSASVKSTAPVLDNLAVSGNFREGFCTHIAKHTEPGLTLRLSCASDTFTFLSIYNGMLSEAGMTSIFGKRVLYRDIPASVPSPAWEMLLPTDEMANAAGNKPAAIAGRRIMSIDSGKLFPATDRNFTGLNFV